MSFAVYGEANDTKLARTKGSAGAVFRLIQSTAKHITEGTALFVPSVYVIIIKNVLRWSWKMIYLAMILLIVILLLRKNKTTQSPILWNSSSAIGKDGEKKVARVLCSLPQEYLVMNDVTIPDQVIDPTKRHTTQIDHIVVSPFGVFVIETKNYSGWIFGSEKSKRWKQSFKTAPGHFFYNPIKQNWGHAYALAEHLNLDIRVFKPLVVFSSDRCKLNVDANMPVVYLSQLNRQIISYTQEIIPREKLALIFDKISKMDLGGEEIEGQHIQSIRERLYEKESTLQGSKCPKCGGLLKRRNGKYGAFYGCSNYPACRYTHDV